MNIVWNISQLDCYPQADGETDVVFNVHWQCNGAEENGGKTYNASVYNTCAIQLDSKEPFTPYADLTQDQVLNWVWSCGVDKAETEAAVAQIIEAQINPAVIAPPLPWATQK